MSKEGGEPSLFDLFYGSEEVSHESIHLVGWKWHEFGINFTIVTILTLVAIVKIVFHGGCMKVQVPESCLLIVLGILSGLALEYGLEGDTPVPPFTSDLFFHVLLPPIILNSAFCLYDNAFFANIGSILTFAIIGTLINMLVIGTLLWATIVVAEWTDRPCPDLTLLQALIFAALISAVDPVAVLAIFDEIGVNLNLYFLVFGESLLNDGITIVLYNSMISFEHQDPGPGPICNVILSLFTVVLGGLFCGFVFGAISALLLRFTSHSRVMEPLVIVLLAYMSFITAEMLYWSGIIALIGCGIVQKRYAFLNASGKTYTTVKYSIMTLSSINECLVFLYLGHVTVSTTHEFHASFIVWSCVLCFLTRFLSTFGLSFLLNKIRTKEIKFKDQFVLSYGGLRGAVSFSLAYVISDENQLKQLFLTTTLIIIFMTVFVQGGSIKFFIRKMHIAMHHKEASMAAEINGKLFEHIMTGIEDITGQISGQALVEKVRYLDEKFLKKLLLSKQALSKFELRIRRITLDQHFARLYGPTVLIQKREQRTSKARQKEQPNEQTSLIKRNPQPTHLQAILQSAFKSHEFDRYQKRYISRQYSNQSSLHRQLELRNREADDIGRRLSTIPELNQDPFDLKRVYTLYKKRRLF